MREWYKDNIERERQKRKEWQEAHPEEHKLHMEAYAARKKAQKQAAKLKEKRNKK
jgi:hypothetical protein